MNIILAAGLFMISFILRIWVRIPRKDFGVDTWYFLNYAQAFRKSRRLPARLDNYLLDIEEQWYPPLLAFILSLFPRKITDTHHWVFSAVIDSIQAVILYYFSFILTSRVDVAIFAALLYIASTVNASMSTNLNARPLAALICTLLMLAIYNYSLNSNIYSLVVVLVLGAILLHTHKMATQQLLFFAAGLSIFYRDWKYIYILGLIFITAIISTRGFYFKILKNNIEIVRFWARNLPYLLKHQVYASSLYKDAGKAGSRMGISGLKMNRFMFLLARGQLLFFFFLVIIIWMKKADIRCVSINTSFLFYWVFINFFTVIATTYLPFFKFIGEGFKYLIYGTFPVSFLVSLGAIALMPSLMVSYSVLILLAGVCIYLQAFTVSRQLLNVNSYVDDELKEVINILKKSDKDNVMCIPVFKAEPVAYLGGKKVLWGAHGSGWDKMDEFWPVIKVPLEKLIEKYKINFMLIDKRFVDKEDLKIDSLIKETVHNGQNYILARVA